MISEQVKRALQMLQFDEVPKMAELRSRFLKLCVERHPDKGGTSEQFQELLEAKEVVSKYIEEYVPESLNDD